MYEPGSNLEEIEKQLTDADRDKALKNFAEEIVSQAAEEVREKRTREVEAARIAPLKQAYSDAVAGIVANYPFSQRREQLNALKAEFRQKGLDVDRVVLSSNVLIQGRRDPIGEIPTFDDDPETEKLEVLERANQILADQQENALQAQYLKALAQLSRSGVVGADRRRKADEIRERYHRQGLKGY